MDEKAMIDFMQLEAVIWDMDGVLLDSRHSHFKAWGAIFDKYEMIANEQQMQRTFGMTNKQVIQHIVDKPIPEELCNRIGSEKDIIFQRYIRDQAMYLPGVEKWLKAFRQNGICQALASSGSPGNIRVILKALTAETYFDRVVSGDGQPSKPDPFIFLKTADEIKKIPLNCLVFEDSVAGVQAAKAAGMKCVAVTTTNPARKLDDADVVLDNFSQLETEHIQKLFSN
jgi:HAD superfamily hydrolase (TIGR01509 family)